MPIRRRGVGVNPKVLFAPSDGQFYTATDMQRCLDQQQPIAGHAMPKYLYPHPESPVQPPLLRYGWILGEKKLLQILLEYFPDCIICSDKPDIILHDGDRASVSAPFDVEIPHLRWTLKNTRLKDTISERCGKFPSLSAISFSFMLDRSEFPGCEWGISVGTNRTGRLKDEYVQQVQAIFAPNTDPKWYLDLEEWRWTRPT